MHIFEFWCQNLVLGLWFWLKNFNMITREGKLFSKTIGNNDFSYCNSGKEEPLIFLGHFIRLWFNEFLQENVEWSFRGFLSIPQTRNWSSKEKKLSNNDFSYCDSRKEEPLIFLGHFIRLWFNEFLQENMAWSFIEDFLMRMTFLLRGRNWRISNFMPRNFTKLRFYQNPSGYNLKSFQSLSRDLKTSPWICDWPKQTNHRAGFRIDWSAAQIHGGISRRNF